MFCVKSTDFKTCDVIIGIAEQWKLHLCLFILNPKYYQNEFDQMLVRCMINISNMFLAQCWKLETSSRPFYDFIKTIYRDLPIFNSGHVPFLIVPYSPWNIDIIA